MNILVVNWTWYPSGGDWTYVENLCKFYESKGHNVIPFSMQDDRNFQTDFSDDFVSKIDYKQLNKSKNIFNALKVVLKSIYSFEARKKIKKIISENKIDIVHLNNVHHYITPSSIIPVLKKKGIPIIWTTHDYSILCPNTTFISQGSICEKCKVGKFYQCTLNKCKKGSTAASIVATLESYINKWINPYKDVDFFICPSDFIAQKFLEYGFAKDKVVNIYNLFDTKSLESFVPNEISETNYVLYVGNILEVKGVFTLLKAIKDTNVTLCIIGAGEDLDKLQEFKLTHQLDNVILLGKKSKQEVLSYVSKSKFVIVPSEWYENLPYSLVEALLLGKPVLGANIGGIPELVINDYTGILFEPADDNDLRKKLEILLSLTQQEMDILGENARLHARNMVNTMNFSQNLSPLYKNLGLTL